MLAEPYDTVSEILIDKDRYSVLCEQSLLEYKYQDLDSKWRDHKSSDARRTRVQVYCVFLRKEPKVIVYKVMRELVSDCIADITYL